MRIRVRFVGAVMVFGAFAACGSGTGAQDAISASTTASREVPSNTVCIPVGNSTGTCGSDTTEAGPLVDFPNEWRGATSSVQFRRVTGTSNGCGDTQVNPPAERPAALTALEGQCLSVDSSSLVLAQSTASAQFEEYNKAWSVRLRLSTSDSQQFDAMAEKNLGSQIAIVVFGNVISAPTIQAIKFDGQPVITGRFSEDFARSLAKSISGG